MFNAGTHLTEKHLYVDERNSLIEHERKKKEKSVSDETIKNGVNQRGKVKTVLQIK